MRLSDPYQEWTEYNGRVKQGKCDPSILHSCWERLVGRSQWCGDGYYWGWGDQWQHRRQWPSSIPGVRSGEPVPGDSRVIRAQSGASVMHMTPLPWHNRRRGNFTNSRSCQRLCKYWNLTSEGHPDGPGLFHQRQDDWLLREQVRQQPQNWSTSPIVSGISILLQCKGGIYRYSVQFVQSQPE